MILRKLRFTNDHEDLKKTGVLKDWEGIYRRSNEIRHFINDTNGKLHDCYLSSDKNIFAFVYDVDEAGIYVATAVMDPSCSYEQLLDTVLECLNKAKLIDSIEMTLKEFRDLFDVVRNESLYTNMPSRIELGMDTSPRMLFGADIPFVMQEKIYEVKKLPGRAETMKRAERIMASDSFMQELQRIYAKTNARSFYGHPVHYYITASDWKAARDMIDIMIPALLKNGRLNSSRVAFLNKINSESYKEDSFTNVFHTSVGSTVVVDLSGELSYGNYATGFMRNAELMGKQLKEHGKDELFIFVEIQDRVIYRDENLAKIIGNGDIVRLEEGYGSYERACDYLHDLISRSEFSEYDDGSAANYLPDKTSFTVSDVFEAYNTWYGKGLKTHIYKAYSEVNTVKVDTRIKDVDPYKKLQSLIGLEQIKTITDEIIISAKIQMKRQELGLETTPSCRNMLFYGNPGTAKTTVARLLAQILKEEGILTSGHIVECGRQDLVGRFVGWTAKTVEEKFRQARGGILFIDEAYSLLEEHNTFGTEAINTIVQLMENYRNEVMVIFAGYPDKMKDFVSKNEGLASRIAFQLDFPDYNAEELVEIMDLMLKERDYRMSEEARNKCYALFTEASKIKDFGNGRYVRNVLEQVELRQGNRIAREFAGLDIDKAKMMMIETEDIIDDFNFITERNNNRRIGFAE